ncbi:Lysophospholipase L1 [Chitinophaga costaii]|uniref:Lysophospholipase L1 n=2 Tax=Chitinophaga costaii TaxID=1335309 RepID=A0A1C4E127_9BACT|nr:SGNH/GDSL hydrolase family protein [Chitinophaga costaii]SCC37316.1 Lysophospholipase L1 [Chitinophaga costaii]
MGVVLFGVTSFRPETCTWTAIGDSITYLNDHLDETGHRVTKGYLTAVVEQLPAIQYINQGHNGWTAVQIAKEIDKLGLTSSDVYTILLGTNDWWAGLPLGTLNDYKNGTSTGTTCGAFRVIIDKIRALNPHAKIILITPLQRGDFVYIADHRNHATGSYQAKNGQLLSQFADAVKEIGAYEHLTVVDLYYKSGITPANVVNFKYMKNPATGQYERYSFPAYQGIPYNPDTDEYPYPVAAINYTYDGLHPSDKGNKKIADMLVPQLKQH